MTDTKFLVDLGMALLAALAGGLIARLLKLPLLVGYLGAGIAVGPHTPGFIADEKAVHSVATLGVALLMFAVGTHLSLKELGAVRRIALQGGGIQILGTILLGCLLGPALGWGPYGGLFLGCVLALSSTAVMMHMLEERGDLGSAHGMAMMGILVVQDLAAVLMVALLPSLAALSESGAAALADVGLSLLKAAVSLVLAVSMALRGVPALLERVARLGSRELFLLVVVCVCLLAGYLAHEAGYSLELGAFLAGLVISESDYAHEVSNQVRPLRDLFAALFFVSIGMLLDPVFVLENLPIVLAVLLAILAGKALIAGAAVYAAGLHGRTAILAGLGLAQIGEFSFVLTAIAGEKGLIPKDLSGVILASALLSILMTPFMFAAAGPLYQRLARFPRLAGWLNRPPSGEETPAPDPAVSSPQALILGCGRMGRYVSESLQAMHIPHVVIDYDTNAIQRLRQAGVPAVFGDATSDLVLRQGRPAEARLAVITLPEAETTRMAVRALKRLSPSLEIVARLHRGVDIPATRQAGADEVVHAEFEAGTELIRLGLHRLGVPTDSIDDYLARVREQRYRLEV